MIFFPKLGNEFKWMIGQMNECNYQHGWMLNIPQMIKNIKNYQKRKKLQSFFKNKK